MKEITRIIAFYESLKRKADVACALAMVVYVEGSSYRRTGARMLVSEDGFWEGGISGGCLEGDALKKARMAILKSKPELVRYDTTKGDDNQIGVGLGCNGVIDVLFIPVDFENENNPIEILKKSFENNNKPLVVITNSLKEPELLGKLFYFESKQSIDFLKNHLDVGLFSEEILALEKSKNYNIDNELRLFVEILPKPITVYLFGNQYDIYPLIELLKMLYWEVRIVSEPNKIQNRKDLTIIAPSDFSENLLDKNSAALLMSHSLETDKKNLRKLATSSVKYIGMLGPKTRSERILNELAAEGIKIDSNKIFAPTGLDLGASTPEEIALSIVAELKAVFSGRNGGFLRERELPINERNQEIFKFN
jgi:xanthine dehydrogenase accessory factor